MMEVQSTADSVNISHSLDFPDPEFTSNTDQCSNSDKSSNCPSSESGDSNASTDTNCASFLSKDCDFASKVQKPAEVPSKDDEDRKLCDKVPLETDPAILDSTAQLEDGQGRSPQMGEILRSMEMGRQKRNSKRKRESERHCPVCGITIWLPELENHFLQEVEKLTKIARNVRKCRKEESDKNKTFEQVKHNRENRLTAKVAQYKNRAKNEVQCPVCNLKMSGTQEEVNKHVLQCLKHGVNSDTDDELIVDDDDESFEEYEFADQTRTRAISLVPGGYRSLEGQTTGQRTNEDEDLNVDIDDTLAYGKPQYTELDVIPCTTSEHEDREREELRRAFLVDSTYRPRVLESRKWSTSEKDSITQSQETTTDTQSHDSTGNNENTLDSILNDVEVICKPKTDHVVSALKEKIRDLEDQNNSVKCLICMETYTKPVVSISCWHVYCEECWLMTMGVKKLCPQCNMIVFPSDLRRIYL